MSQRALALASSPLHSCSLSRNPGPNPRSRSQIRRSLHEPRSRSQIRRSLHCLSRWPSGRRCYSSLRESSSSLYLPLLPFQSDEVLVPTESKTLHLYEARFLALLEESLLTKEKIFVHFVLDPVLTGRSSSGASFAARYGCLVFIEKIERLDIGALISIRGVGRVSIVDIIQMEPYLRGVVVPMQDNVSDYGNEMQPKLEELKESLHNLQKLQIKLKASKEEPLQTQIKNSLSWAASEVHWDCDPSFVPALAERLSFAALQPVSGFSQSEVLSLQKEKLRAMDMRDTLERLKMSIEFVKQNIAIIAAKLAIQSLEM